jgi:hypothetical protein
LHLTALKKKTYLVEIGLTDWPKSGCAMAHPGTTGLVSQDFQAWQSKYVLLIIFSNPDPAIDGLHFNKLESFNE